MNSRKEEDRLRHAIDTTLSGLADDPWLARRVLTKAKGEEKVKKKQNRKERKVRTTEHRRLKNEKEKGTIEDD